MISIYTLWHAFGGACCYCGCDTYIPGRHPKRMVQKRYGIVAESPGSRAALRHRQATREHIKRVADGGGDGVDNLTLACAFCNGHRGDTPPEQHRANMAAYIAAGIHPNHGGSAPLPKRTAVRMRRELRIGATA